MPDPSTGQPHFDAAQRRQLVQHARDAVGAALRGESAPSGKGSGALREACGVFVTWRRQIDGRLRGCIGQVEAREPLEDAVAHMAVAAALEDPRFAPVSLAEIPKLRLEISVLSRFVPIRPEDIVVGRHGLMIRHGAHRGLLLPQVPVEEGWDRETFLDGVCRKAGLHPGAWRESEAELQGFTATVFGEEPRPTNG
jgi:AmmeMemoRadiSam system protein A